ncbi:MAG: hypothetical protein ACTHL8_05385 [Burkholderiaceae bacterium]
MTMNRAEAFAAVAHAATPRRPVVHLPARRPLGRLEALRIVADLERSLPRRPGVRHPGSAYHDQLRAALGARFGSPSKEARR